MRNYTIRSRDTSLSRTMRPRISNLLDYSHDHDRGIQKSIFGCSRTIQGLIRNPTDQSHEYSQSARHDIILIHDLNRQDEWTIYTYETCNIAPQLLWLYAVNINNRACSDAYNTYSTDQLRPILNSNLTQRLVRVSYDGCSITVSETSAHTSHRYLLRLFYGQYTASISASAHVFLYLMWICYSWKAFTSSSAFHVPNWTCYFLPSPASVDKRTCQLTRDDRLDTRTR